MAELLPYIQFSNENNCFEFNNCQVLAALQVTPGWNVSKEAQCEDCCPDCVDEEFSGDLHTDDVWWHDPAVPPSQQFLGMLIRSLEIEPSASVRRRGETLAEQPEYSPRRLVLQGTIVSTSRAGTYFAETKILEQFTDECGGCDFVAEVLPYCTEVNLDDFPPNIEIWEELEPDYQLKTECEPCSEIPDLYETKLLGPSRYGPQEIDTGRRTLMRVRFVSFDMNEEVESDLDYCHGREVKLNFEVVDDYEWSEGLVGCEIPIGGVPADLECPQPPNPENFNVFVDPSDLDSFGPNRDSCTWIVAGDRFDAGLTVGLDQGTVWGPDGVTSFDHLDGNDIRLATDSVAGVPGDVLCMNLQWVNDGSYSSANNSGAYNTQVNTPPSDPLFYDGTRTQYACTAERVTVGPCCTPVTVSTGFRVEEWMVYAQDQKAVLHNLHAPNGANISSPLGTRIDWGSLIFETRDSLAVPPDNDNSNPTIRAEIPLTAEDIGSWWGVVYEYCLDPTGQSGYYNVFIDKGDGNGWDQVVDVDGPVGYWFGPGNGLNDLFYPIVLNYYSWHAYVGSQTTDSTNFDQNYQTRGMCYSHAAVTIEGQLSAEDQIETADYFLYECDPARRSCRSIDWSKCRSIPPKNGCESVEDSLAQGVVVEPARNPIGGESVYCTPMYRDLSGCLSPLFETSGLLAPSITVFAGEKDLKNLRFDIWPAIEGRPSPMSCEGEKFYSRMVPCVSGSIGPVPAKSYINLDPRKRQVLLTCGNDEERQDQLMEGWNFPMVDPGCRYWLTFTSDCLNTADDAFLTVEWFLRFQG